MSEEVTLRSMSALKPDDSGMSIRFAIEGEGGRDVDVACPHDKVERVIRFLIELARNAALRRSERPRHSFGRAEQADIDPAPVSSATFMVEPETQEVVLALRMFGFDLGFSLSPEHLVGLKRELDRILPALGVVEPQGHHHGHDHHH